ncbi:calponin homology domain-containing protein DDB_G0272472-like isoform X2 [Crotalus tigris]|uniref:calponin homology domain-containing protein DDB_G0272472-like isoform X2 n=1 Tax=Crotalus tigris TaxID=88082 RepID=UPI00192F7860|nr:calponin homology domain-containing protein DDB_G0272472-like isoform X2 [Crotalus tigris]
MRETAVPLVKRLHPCTKGHCDFLLDCIDAQLNPMQGPGPRIKGSSWDGPLGLGETEATSRTADPGRTNAGGDGDMSSREMDRRRQLLHLPDSKEAPSRSDSVCTEDLAAEFHKGLVDLGLSSGEDEAVSGLALGPRDVRPPTSKATVLPEMAGPCPPFRSLHPALDSHRLEPTSKRWPAEVSKEKRSQELAPPSREWPLWGLPRDGLKNMAPLTQHRVKNCSAKSSSGTDAGRGGQPWKRSLHARLQSSREEGGKVDSRKSEFLGLERGGKGLEQSSEQRQSFNRSSKHWLIVGEPQSSWQRARRTTSNIRVPPRRAEVSHSEKTSSYFNFSSSSSFSSQHAAVELETFQEALRERQELARRLELQMEEHQEKVEKARADLGLLEYKQETCLKEVMELEQELSMLRWQGRQYGAVQVEVSRLVSEREELKDQVRCLEDQLSSLKLQLKSSRTLLSSMEEMASEKTKQLQEALLSKKDLEIARMHKTLSVLEAEKGALDGIVRSLKEEHQQQMKQLQQEAFQEKEKELCKLREEMQLEKKQALQECAESSEEAKASALREQADTFQKEIEDLQKIIKEREAEAIRQQEALQQQAAALKVEAKEMVQNSLVQEQKKWEAHAQAALQMQWEALREQDRKRRVDLQRALEKERKLSSALRDAEADLRRKIEGLENQTRLLEEEKRASLEELQVGLQKEKDEALQRLREELDQERTQEKEETRVKLQQMEEDREHLQAECSRLSLREREAQAQAERMDQFLATQIVLACRQLQQLLPEKAVLLPHLLYREGLPLSSGAALQALREAREEIQSYIQDLNQELEGQKQRIFQIQREKELELRQQKEQLRLESQSVLEGLKEQLVHEHMDDILTLQRSWLKERQEKDKSRFCSPQEEGVGELHVAQKNVAYGKDKADRMPINEPKEELDREPERCLSSNFCKNLATPGSEGRRFSTMPKWLAKDGTETFPVTRRPQRLFVSTLLWPTAQQPCWI